jgi:hypothetical protein
MYDWWDDDDDDDDGDDDDALKQLIKKSTHRIATAISRGFFISLWGSFRETIS